MHTIVITPRKQQYFRASCVGDRLQPIISIAVFCGHWYLYVYTALERRWGHCSPNLLGLDLTSKME